MTEEQKNETHLTSIEAFHAIGLKWEGTFAQAGAGSIRDVHKELQDRLKEIPHVVIPAKMLGLSYHAVPEGQGFIHFAAVEVDKVEEVPAGMVTVSVPTLTYAT